MHPGDVFAERALQWRHPPARHHRGDAGVRRRRQDHPVLVASRGHHADVGGMAPGSMTPLRHDRRRGRRADRQLQDGRQGHLPGEGTYRASDLRPYPCRNPGQNIADLKAQIAANEKGVQELAKMVKPVRPRRGAGLHEPRAGQCRGKRAPGDRRAARLRIRLRDGCGPAYPREDHRGSRQPLGDRRFHRHVGQQPNNFNAPLPVAPMRRCSMCSAAWWQTTSP
jgi:5-oxoprolinase (ATP-hydrolysing)